MNTISLLKEGKNICLLILISIFALFFISPVYSTTSFKQDSPPFLLREQGRSSVDGTLTVFPFRNSTGTYTLALDEKVKGHRHPDTARELNNQGELYTAMGDYGKARTLFEQALSIYEEIYGPKASAVATVLNNLALIYQTVGEYDKAQSFYDRVLLICRVFVPVL